MESLQRAVGTSFGMGRIVDVITRRIFRGLSDGRYYIPRRWPAFSLADAAFAIVIGIALAFVLAAWSSQ